MSSSENIYQKYIVVGNNGLWGKGDSLKTALRMLRAVCYRRDTIALVDQRVYKFDSKIRFPDYDKPATLKEADCWVNADGSVSRVRCACKLLTITKGKRRWISQ